MPNTPGKYEAALAEIGPIVPWKDVYGYYVFEHPAFPRVMHADRDKEACIEGYKRALYGWLEAQ